MATYHPMYFLYWETQKGRRNGTECVSVCVCVCICVCTLMLCLFFTGDSPSSLAGSQDLFSLLYITANNIIETVSFPFSSSTSSFCFCSPDVSLSPLPYLPICAGPYKTSLCFYTLQFHHSNIHEIKMWRVRNRCSLTTPKAFFGRAQNSAWDVNLFFNWNAPWGLPKGLERTIRYTICLQDSNQLGTRAR